MDRILNFWKVQREKREISDNIYFYTPLTYSIVSELWLFVSRRVMAPQNRLKF